MTTEGLTALLETPAAFRTWLEGKDPGEAVGEVADTECCPIAMFLQDNGAYLPAVDADEIYISTETDGTLITPRPWLQTFIPSVDEKETQFTRRWVTAAECLKILDGIEG